MLLCTQAAQAAVEVGYGPAAEQRLDIYMPPSGKDHPAALLIHGGGWQSGDKRDYRWLAQKAAAQGIVAIAVNYRLASGVVGHRLADQLDDLALAARYVRDQAGSLGIDIRRICVFGSSAGGHLALVMALRPPRDGIRFACVVDEFAPVDLTTYPPPEALLFGGVGHAEASSLLREYSPVYMTSSQAPPILVVHGDRDQMVPIGQSQALLRAVKQAGGQARMLTFDGGHSFAGTTSATRDGIAGAEIDFILHAPPVIATGPGR
jgi:acetyl esterase/lipase